jgi:hypothetical protein
MTYPVKSKDASVVAEKFLDFCALFGTPRKILSDNGPEFVAKVVDDALRSRYVYHLVSTPYHPQTNGVVERFNRSLLELLRKLAQHDPADWDRWLPYATLLYRWHRYSATGYAPSELLFGRWIGVFEEDLMGDLVNTQDPLTPEQFIAKLDILRNRASENHLHSAETRAKVQDSRGKVTGESLETGTWVRIRSDSGDKLAPKWSSAAQVLRQAQNGNYVLRDGEGGVLIRSYPRDMLMEVKSSWSGEKQMGQRLLSYRRPGHDYEYELEGQDGSSGYVPDNLLDSRDVARFWKSSMRPSL